MLKVHDIDFFKQFTDKETFAKLKKYETIQSLLKEKKNEAKDFLALSYKNETLTYAQLYKRCCQTTNIAMSIKKNSHVAILCNSDMNFITTTLGLIANGLTVVFIPTSLSALEINLLVDKYDITALFYSSDFQKVIDELNVSIEKVNIQEILNSKAKSFTRKVRESDVAAIIFSRKENGELRGAMLTHKSLMTSAYYGTLGIKKTYNQRYYSILPFTHVFGFVRNILTPLSTSSSIYICSNMRRMFKEIPDCRPTMMVLVPGILEMILNVSKKFKMDLFNRQLHTIIVGGAAMPTYLIEQYKQLGADIFQGYGMTETSSLISGNMDPYNKPLSVGVFFPNQEAKIINNELYIKGENQMSGYYNDIEETNKVMVDGFIKTGDLAYVDEDNFLYLQGRCDNIIILTNGENVSPVKIENKVNNIDFVLASLVYAEEDLLTIDVVLRKEAIKDIIDVDKALKDEIANINKTLATFERVCKINIVDSLPYDENMKLIRKRG